MPSKTLLFLSGGLDSTTALVKMLRETDDTIVVHRIDYRNSERRCEAERAAVAAIVPICRAIRSFPMTRTSQDYTGAALPMDVHVVRFTAGTICRFGGKYDKVATGTCVEDENPGHAQRLREGDAIFAAVMAGRAMPEWIFPVRHMRKADEIAYLREYAPALLPLVHYCRRPVLRDNAWKNCGKCRTCLQTRAAAPDVYAMRE